MISVKNFVKSDIEILTERAVSFNGFRTTLYFANVTIVTPDVSGGSFATLHSAGDDVKISGASDSVKESISAYFHNGGDKLCVVKPSAYTLAGFKEDLLAVSKVVTDFFFVVISNSLMLGGGYSESELVGIVGFGSGESWGSSDIAFNKFRICLTTSESTFVDDLNLGGYSAVVKYTNYEKSGDLVDAALLVGAYFSSIDPSEIGAIKDYNFTPEYLGGEYEDVSQDLFETLNGRKTPNLGNYNFIGKVSNRILNIGGDYCSTANESISLDFGVSCIERDLDYAVLEHLFGKLRVNQEGQSKLIDAIKSQLGKYVGNGFLEQDATFVGDTKKVFYNGTQYTVITKGDLLPLGYKVFFVPINAIDAADRAAKRFPYIYVALQTVHGARVIQINGGIV